MTCSVCKGKGFVEIDSGGVTPWNAPIVDYDFCVCNPRCECKKPVIYQMLSNGEVCYTCGLRLPSASPNVYELVAIARLTPHVPDDGDSPGPDDLPFGGWVPNEADLPFNSHRG